MKKKWKLTSKNFPKDYTKENRRLTNIKQSEIAKSALLLAGLIVVVGICAYGIVQGARADYFENMVEEMER